MEVRLYVDRSGMVVARQFVFAPMMSCLVSTNFGQLFDHAALHCFFCFLSFGIARTVWKKRCNYRHTIRMVLDRRHSLVTRPEKSIYCGIGTYMCGDSSSESEVRTTNKLLVIIY